jgi:signal transduction histidine kinase
MEDSSPDRAAPNRLFLAFQIGVILPTLGGGALLALRRPADLQPELFLWAALIAVVELLPVPAWHGLQVSVGLPLLIMVGILYPPLTAGCIALLAASDPREYQRKVSLLSAVFNRCQVALSVFAASEVFHAVTGIQGQNAIRSAATLVLLGAAMLAAVADYVVNSGLVTAAMSLQTGLKPSQVVKELKIGELREFLVSYIGLGILGLSLVEFYLRAGPLSLPVFFAPLLLARQMFLRSRALEEAHKELQEREQVLKSLSNAMAEERQDERLQIAGYLHDDLAQILFRLSIQVDVAKRLMEKGALDDAFLQLEKIRQSKQDTSDRIRALIRDLHRSPLGPKGLREALESFTDEMGRDSGVTFHTDVQEIALPAPIALLVYHIAREGVMNALKHAHATDLWITVHETPTEIVLQLRDNGAGFDTSAAGPEGHFGMAMMRERATVGGGSFTVESAVGKGTTITVRFPTSLLQPPAPEGPGGATPEPPRASPGTSETTGSAADGSRQSVRA